MCLNGFAPLGHAEPGRGLPLCLAWATSAGRISPVDQFTSERAYLRISNKHFALGIDDRNGHYNCGDVLHAFRSGVTTHYWRGWGRILGAGRGWGWHGLGWVWRDRKSTRLDSSHRPNSYAAFCLSK